jgi:hypothetical protein
MIPIEAAHSKPKSSLMSDLGLPSAILPDMEIRRAIDAMARILLEERQRPTIKYRDNLSDVMDPATGPGFGAVAQLASGLLSGRPNSAEARKSRPREVWEWPEAFTFGGTNYDLLLRLYNEVLENERRAFVEAMLIIVKKGGFVGNEGASYHFPAFQGHISDMPLIAEFCIRTGNTERLMGAAGEAEKPTDGLALMLMQIEETIGLNFNVFTEDELRQIPKWLSLTREKADRQRPSARGARSGTLLENPQRRTDWEAAAKRIFDSINGITTECNQAIFFYLKRALQQTRNPEVEADKVRLTKFLETLGFSPRLRESLDEAEKQYRDDSSPFELKSCFAHLRSFLEVMHRESAMSIASAAGEVVVDKWGSALDYLRRKAIFSQQHEAFVSSLYTLISDTSVHPLAAECCD